LQHTGDEDGVIGGRSIQPLVVIVTLGVERVFNLLMALHVAAHQPVQLGVSCRMTGIPGSAVKC
jgi:hypothetical protein